MPKEALIASTGLGLLCVLTVGLALARNPADILALEEDAPISADGGVTGAGRAGPSASVTPTADATTARLSAAELDTARQGGVDALNQLALRFPEDPTVLNTLCMALREKQDYAGALRVLRHLLEIAPDRTADKDVRQLLMEIANGPNETAAEAFEVMKARMDTAGPDILYDLAVAPATKPSARARAETALTDPAVLARGTKALQVAEDLRHKTPCTRKAVAGRALEDGDARSLVFLKPLATPTKPCRGGNALTRLLGGAGDCGPSYACITQADRTAIAAAVDAIEKREKH